MKLYLCLVLLLTTTLGLSTTTPAPTPAANLEGIKYQCSFFENFSIFSYKIIEDKIPDSDFNTTVIEDPTRVVFFSFCNDSDIECDNLGPDDPRGSALLKNTDDGTCLRIASSDWNDVEVTYVEYDLDRSRDFLRLSWTGDDVCEFGEEGTKWNFSIDVVCSDVSVEDSRFFYTGGYDDSCHIITQVESKLGCALVSYRQIMDFVNANYVIFGITLIAVGFFLCIAGYRIIIVSLFLAGLFATAVALCFVAYQFIIPKDSKHLYYWIALGVSVVIGAIVGFLVAKYRKVGIFLLACWGGACLGLLLNNAVMRYAQSEILFWIVVAGCGVALGVISCFVYVIVSIGCTSVIGAYALVRGISTFLGGYPNEMTLIQELKNGTIPKTQWQFWAYLAGMLVIAIVSFYIQWKYRPERKGGKKKGEYYRKL